MLKLYRYLPYIKIIRHMGYPIEQKHCLSFSHLFPRLYSCAHIVVSKPWYKNKGLSVFEQIQLILLALFSPSMMWRNIEKRELRFFEVWCSENLLTINEHIGSDSIPYPIQKLSKVCTSFGMMQRKITAYKLMNSQASVYLSKVTTNGTARYGWFKQLKEFKRGRTG